MSVVLPCRVTVDELCRFRLSGPSWVTVNSAAAFLFDRTAVWTVPAFQAPNCLGIHMKFSVTYPLVTHPASPELMSREAITRFVQTAEAAGFDGVGFTDHPAPTDKWLNAGGHDALDPFVTLTYCAAVTERIRLIPNIVVLPYRHPLIVAKMVATMDMLSDHRFTLAVATGYLRGEYRALGIDFEQRNALFDQAIEVLRGMWTQDNFSFEGIGIDAKGLTANPKPHVSPPIWIGGNSRQARRRVARYGDGWTPFPAPKSLSATAKTPSLETVDDLAVMLDQLWQFVDEEGRNRSDIDVCVLHAGRRSAGRSIRCRCAPRRPGAIGHAGCHLGRRLGSRRIPGTVPRGIGTLRHIGDCVLPILTAQRRHGPVLSGTQLSSSPQPSSSANNSSTLLGRRSPRSSSLRQPWTYVLRGSSIPRAWTPPAGARMPMMSASPVGS